MLTPRPLRADINQRLRTLRNLIFGSSDEIRPKNFPALLNETAEYLTTGDLSRLNTFYKRQVAEEESKERLLSRYPEHPRLQEALHRLEDHFLLRGCLAAFDLEVDADIFIRRAELFQQIFSADCDLPFDKISAALLASGDYSQHPRRVDRYQFGSPSRTRVWLELLTGQDIANTNKALMKMLDDFASAKGASVEERLQAVTDTYLARQLSARTLDWRYYLAKYPEMRSGPSGLYASSKNAMGFDLCMMKETQLNGAYRDPYLLAVLVQSGAKEGKDVVELKHFGWDFYEPKKRWIELACTGERIMSCREEGFEVRTPSDAGSRAEFTTIFNKYKVGDDLLLRMPQIVVDGVTYDQEDRIKVAAELLKELIAVQQIL